MGPPLNLLKFLLLILYHQQIIIGEYYDFIQTISNQYGSVNVEFLVELHVNNIFVPLTCKTIGARQGPINVISSYPHQILQTDCSSRGLRHVTCVFRGF